MTADVLPTPDDLRTYLRLKGWVEDASGRNASLWLNLTDGRGPSSTILVPHIQSASDYSSRVGMLLRELSRLQEQSVDAVRREAGLVYFDVVPVRADDVDIDDSIPLQASIELYGSVRKMVVASAGATLRRASHFGQGLPARAKAHSRVVRVGQTQRGSYVVPIISRARFAAPSEEADEMTDGGQHLDLKVEESLFDRRVLSTMATALDTLHQISSAARLPSGAELSDAVSVGVSRDLCVGVEKALKSPSISELSLKFQWAAAAKPPRDVKGEVVFAEPAAEAIREVSDRLRALDRPKEDVLYGLVTELRHRPNDPDRRVGVEALVGRRLRTVFMNLTPEQYEIAQESHERSKVIVRGQLRAPVGERAEMKVDFFGPDTSLL